MMIHENASNESNSRGIAYQKKKQPSKIKRLLLKKAASSSISTTIKGDPLASNTRLTASVYLISP